MLTVAAIGAALTTLLPAQTAVQSSANRFIPENSALVLRMASPAKWRKQFGTTQVAKLAEADSLTPFLGMASQQIEMGMDMLRDSGVFDAELASGLLNTWQGDIVVSVQVDWAGVVDAMNYGDAPPWSMVVALTPDGSFDLAAVAKEFAQMVEKTAPDGGGLKDMVVGDLTLRRSDNGCEEPDAALPTMVDGNLVMIVGTQLEKDAQKLLAKDARFAMKDDAPFYMHADLGGLISTALKAGSEGAPFDVAAMMDSLGFNALQGLTFSLRPDGKSIAGSMHLGMKKEGRGMFNMMSRGNQQQKLLTSVPANSDAFSVSAVDLKVFYKTASELWSTMEDMVPMSFDDAMGTFTEATKVRLKEDLIDQLGNEIMTVQDVEALTSDAAIDIEEDPTAMLSGSVYGISLRDGDAFGTALDKAMRARGLHVGRKTEDYANVQVNRMKLAGMVEIEYVVTKDLLLLGIGGQEGTKRILRDILDTRASGESKVPAIIAKRGAEFAPGWNSIGLTPIGAMLEGAITGLQASGQFGEEMDTISQVVRGVVADMKRIGVSSMLQSSYCDDNGLTTSFRW